MESIDDLIKRELTLYDVVGIDPAVLELIKDLVYISDKVIDDGVPGSLGIPIGTLLFKHHIYNQDRETRIFNYIIDMLQHYPIEVASSIISFFVVLEKKDLHLWINHGYDPGCTFYPLLVFYLLTADHDLFNSQDDPQVLSNVLLLEPINTNWSYFIEFFNIDYLSIDPCILYTIIEDILTSMTVKNIALLSTLKTVVSDTVVYMQEEEMDEEDEYKWFRVKLPAKIKRLENKFRK